MLLFLGGCWAHSCWFAMPGESYAGPLPELTDPERKIAESLRRDVQTLAGDIGFRNAFDMASLKRAADYVASRLEGAGLPVERHGYDLDGRTVENLIGERRGASKPDEIVVVGAHYDSVLGSQGANDNASGVGAMLALAEAFREATPARTVRFVGFVNEEPPYFQKPTMGSLVYARRCRERNESVVAMLSLETMGCYSDAGGSQKYPGPLTLEYPNTGNFIGFVGDTGSGELVRRCLKVFRANAKFPSEGGALPGWISGVGWSDHWSFWQAGYPALMVTDTAPFRYAHYHTNRDTPEKVDCERLARVVAGLIHVVRELADDR